LHPRRILAGFRVLLELAPPGRNLTVRTDDVFVVSYPKSGNTWTRFLIANLVYPEQTPDFGNIDQLIPAPEVMSKRRLNEMNSPRIICTHSWFNPEFNQVIYIVRDPRDIVVSQFHYHRKRKVIDDNYPIEDFVASFILGETDPHGSWKQNVAGWLAARFGDARFLLLRYEDMIQDTHRELEKVARFLGTEAGLERIASAVERSSASQMRKLEEANGDRCARIKDTRRDLPFIRTAKSENWKSELPEQCVAAIEQEWGRWMRWLGYELSSDAKKDESDLMVPESFLGSRTN